MALTAAERRLAGSIGGNLSWAHTPDRAARTRPARQALYEKFLREADGDPIRANHLWRAHFQRLALKSATARRRARNLNAEADKAEAELAEIGGGNDSAA